ncbi:MAG TPA: hypothetical protein VHS78_15140 [Candidatus Elarobacter sp.]|nr:hypothetical protein [Candidatus Elarobacter sp.]
MNALLAVSYADRRAVVHWLRALRRSPGRIAIWATYALGIGVWAVLKLMPGAAAKPLGGFTAASHDAWVCGLAIVFGAALATGSARWLGAFSSRAEALMLVRADPPAALVVVYLQLRAIVVTAGRGVTRYAYFILIALPAAKTPGALLAELGFFAAAGAAIASVPLPRALVRGAARWAATGAGLALIALAAIPLVLDALRVMQLPHTAALLARAPGIHPGLVLDALAAGDARAVALPLVVAACATVAFVLASRDAYPELYAISVANLEQRDARADRAAGRPTRWSAPAAPRIADARAGAAGGLRGALAFFWIDALMFKRRVSPLVRVGIVVLGLLGGAVLWVFAHRSPQPASVVLLSTIPTFAIVLGTTTTVRLVPALRMPLFWLGGAPLAARLASWSLGALSRDLIIAAAVATGYAVAGGEWRDPAALLIGAAGFLALSRTIGLAVFAMVPDPLDQYGPAAFARAFFFFVLLAPPWIAGLITAYALNAPLVIAIAAATLTALVEAALLIHIAALHLARGIDRLPAP